MLNFDPATVSLPGSSINASSPRPSCDPPLPESDGFDYLLRWATSIFSVPAAVVFLDSAVQYDLRTSFDLVTRGAPWRAPLSPSTIRHARRFSVNDTTPDGQPPRMRTGTEEPILFYVEAPIVDFAGTRIGAFAILDVKTRSITRAQTKILSCFAQFSCELLQEKSLPQDRPRLYYDEVERRFAPVRREFDRQQYQQRLRSFIRLGSDACETGIVV